VAQSLNTAKPRLIFVLGLPVLFLCKKIAQKGRRKFLKKLRYGCCNFDPFFFGRGAGVFTPLAPLSFFNWSKRRKKGGCQGLRFYIAKKGMG